MIFAIDSASHHGCCQCQHAGERNIDNKEGNESGSSARGDYNCAMYIIAIGWLYVTVLMALTETSVVAGVLSFLVYGAAPAALLLWLFGGPIRRRNSANVAGDQFARTPDRSDAKPDQ